MNVGIDVEQALRQAFRRGEDRKAPGGIPKTLSHLPWVSQVIFDLLF